MLEYLKRTHKDPFQNNLPALNSNIILAHESTIHQEFNPQLRSVFAGLWWFSCEASAKFNKYCVGAKTCSPEQYELIEFNVTQKPRHLRRAKFPDLICHQNEFPISLIHLVKYEKYWIFGFQPKYVLVKIFSIPHIKNELHATFQLDMFLWGSKWEWVMRNFCLIKFKNCGRNLLSKKFQWYN